MIRLLTSAAVVLTGLCLLSVTAGLVLLAGLYLDKGNGLSTFPWVVSPFTILLGLLHVLGLATIGRFCFVIGIALCAEGFVPASQSREECDPPLTHFLRTVGSIVLRQFHPTEPGPTPRCVRCRVALPGKSHLCPGCGWTQP